MLSTRALCMLGIAAVGLGLLGPSLADACASLRSVDLPIEQTPNVAREQVLLIHDDETNRQHFIREVAFVQGRERFGFVVPTPTRPEVAEVGASPFEQLRASFPITPPKPLPRSAEASKSAPDSEGVQVLEVSKVGSFTAFVLAADDADALAKWLVDNQLTSDPAADAWLARYVELGFFYVALRYDPPVSGTPSEREVVAETVRISFSTPLPYYPYFEPTREPTRGVGSNPRLVELWFVGAEPVVPISLRERDGTRGWVQPFQRGPLTRDARAELEATLAPELAALLPTGPLVVQTFQDQKRSRAGFGDVLFAFQAGRPRTPELEAELAPLLGLLDPGLTADLPPAREPSR